MKKKEKEMRDFKAKENYIQPILEVIEVKVEKGYAASLDGSHSQAGQYDSKESISNWDF
ncbi:MAG: hypothetical protein GX109_05385 [Bacteroidales bacterium]|jgi:hypothetical protein|nr:hypothetical protein [Bacteroidales bacterium]